MEFRTFRLVTRRVYMEGSSYGSLGRGQGIMPLDKNMGDKNVTVVVGGGVVNAVFVVASAVTVVEKMISNDFI